MPVKSAKRKYLFAIDIDLQHGKLTGAYRRFLELINGLIAAGSEVTVIAYPCELFPNNDLLHFLPVKKNKIEKIPDHLAGILVLLEALNVYREQISYDYAVSFGPTVSISYYIAGYRHIVSLFRENLIGYQEAIGSSSFRLLYFSLMERKAVRVSEKIIVQCRNDYDALLRRNRRYCKGLERKVFIQKNNANASWMIREQSEIRRRKHETTQILFLGNFSNPRKGHGIVLPAIAKLLDEDYQIEALIAGDGKELRHYKSQYQKYPAIHFLGRVENVPELLRSCDFEIVPSLIDSCPNTVLEALNAGVAVYGANTGGIPDLLEREEYLFSPDIDGVYYFLKRVIDEKRYLADAEHQADRKKILTFDWSASIQAIMEK